MTESVNMRPKRSILIAVFGDAHILQHVSMIFPQHIPSTYKLLATFGVETDTAQNLPHGAGFLYALVGKATPCHEIQIFLRRICRK